MAPTLHTFYYRYIIPHLSGCVIIFLRIKEMWSDWKCHTSMAEAVKAQGNQITRTIAKDRGDEQATCSELEMWDSLEPLLDTGSRWPSWLYEMGASRYGE